MRVTIKTPVNSSLPGEALFIYFLALACIKSPFILLSCFRFARKRTMTTPVKSSLPWDERYILSPTGNGAFSSDIRSSSG